MGILKSFLLSWLDSPFTDLVAAELKHQKCCRVAANRAIARADYRRAVFNRAIDDAYGQSGNAGCGFSGFMRRHMITHFVMKRIEYQVPPRDAVNPKELEKAGN